MEIITNACGMHLPVTLSAFVLLLCLLPCKWHICEDARLLLLDCMQQLHHHTWWWCGLEGLICFILARMMNAWSSSPDADL